jgi:hypothetical protein
VERAGGTGRRPAPLYFWQGSIVRLESPTMVILVSFAVSP